MNLRFYRVLASVLITLGLLVGTAAAATLGVHALPPIAIG